MKVIYELRKRNKHINRIKSFDDWNKQISNKIKKLKLFQKQITKEIEETSKLIELVISKKLRKKQSEEFFDNKINIYQSIETVIKKLENEQKVAQKRHEDRNKKNDVCINNNYYWREIRKAYRDWKASKEKGDYILIATDNNFYCYKYSDFELRQAQSKLRRRGGLVVVNIGGKLILVASAKKKNIQRELNKVIV